MSAISNTMTNYAENAAIYNKTSSQDKKSQDKKSKTEEKMEIVKKDESPQKVKVSGRTVGNPMLSEKAAKYYEELKRKYGNMDFILVSKDQKEYAKANASKYGNSSKMVVLIDEEKIERMAADEDYRKQYEGIINNATKQLSQIKDSLGLNAGKVKTYGIKVDDGGNASFFAVIDKSYAAQRDRIEKKAEQKAADKKKAEKAAEKKRMEEARTQKAKDKDKTGKYDKEDTVTVTADSVEELLKKINDVIFRQMSDSTRTVQEQKT